MRAWKALILTALSGLFLWGCSGAESPKATVNLSVEFPRSGDMHTQFIGLRSSYIVVTLKNLRTGKEFTAELDRNNPSHTFTDLDEGTYRVTVASYRKKTNNGYESLADYAVATARFVGGSNSLSVSMPRAVWYFDKPITLNGTWSDAKEQVYGIALSPIDIEKVFDEYSVHEAVFFGTNFNDCNGGGSTCVTNMEYSPSFTGPSTTDPRLGNELYLNFYDESLFARLESYGGYDRFMTLVSAPPCTYKKFKDKLISCEFKTSKDLSKYMGVKINGNTMTGYLWEIMMKRQAPGTRITCAWDIDMKNTFSCPANLFNPNPSGGSPYTPTTASKKLGAPNLFAQQGAIKDVDASLKMLFKESNKNYAKCLDDNKTCDYNMNGEIGDPGDDINKDGKIDQNDAKDFYYSYEWQNSFDLYPHPFTATAYQQVTKIDVPLFAGSPDQNSGLLKDLKAIGYDGKLIKAFSQKNAPVVKAVLGWTFTRVDYNKKTFRYPLPRWVAGLIRDSANDEYKFFRIDLFKGKSVSGQLAGSSYPFALSMERLSTKVASSYSICTFLAFVDPLKSAVYIFAHFSGPDGQCASQDDKLLFYDVRRHRFADISGLTDLNQLKGIRPYSDRLREFISGFILPTAPVPPDIPGMGFHCPLPELFRNNCHDAFLYWTANVIECPASRPWGHQLFLTDWSDITGLYAYAWIFDAWNDVFGIINTICGGSTQSGPPSFIVNCILTRWGVYFCVTTDSSTSPTKFTLWEILRESSPGFFKFICRASGNLPTGWDPSSGGILNLYSTMNRVILEFITGGSVRSVSHFVYDSITHTINQIQWPSDITPPRIAGVFPRGFVAPVGPRGWCRWSEGFGKNPYQPRCSDPNKTSNLFAPAALPNPVGYIDHYPSAACDRIGGINNVAGFGAVQEGCTQNKNGECEGGRWRLVDDNDIYGLDKPINPLVDTVDFNLLSGDFPPSAIPNNFWGPGFPFGGVSYSQGTDPYFSIFSPLYNPNGPAGTFNERLEPPPDNEIFP